MKCVAVALLKFLQQSKTVTNFMLDKSLQPNEISRCRFANIFTAKKDSDQFHVR